MREDEENGETKCQSEDCSEDHVRVIKKHASEDEKDGGVKDEGPGGNGEDGEGGIKEGRGDNGGIEEDLQGENGGADRGRPWRNRRR